eukprot:s4663_g1.t1
MNGRSSVLTTWPSRSHFPRRIFAVAAGAESVVLVSSKWWQSRGAGPRHEMSCSSGQGALSCQWGLRVTMWRCKVVALALDMKCHARAARGLCRAMSAGPRHEMSCSSGQGALSCHVVPMMRAPCDDVALQFGALQSRGAGSRHEMSCSSGQGALLCIMSELESQVAMARIEAHEALKERLDELTAGLEAGESATQCKVTWFRSHYFRLWQLLQAMNQEKVDAKDELQSVLASNAEYQLYSEARAGGGVEEVS